MKGLAFENPFTFPISDSLAFPLESLGIPCHPPFVS